MALDISSFTDTYPSHPPKTSYCQYGRRNNTVCSEGTFLIEGEGFKYLENGAILDLQTKIAYHQGTYSTDTDSPHMIFLCGESILAFDLRRINYEVILSCISIAFLVLYLKTDVTRENLKRFQNKVLYSYSITLIMLYLSLIGNILTTVCILWYIRKILRICYCLWAVLMSFEFWRVTYFTLKNRKISTQGQNTRYWVYCFFGYILPLIFAVCFYLSKRNAMNDCPKVVEFWKAPCPILLNGKVSVYAVWQVIRFITFTILLIVLFVQVGVFVYFDKYRRIQSTHSINRNYLLVLIKMAYMMGIYWMIFVYFIILVPQSFRWHDAMRKVINAVFLDLHGVFMYFAFGIERETVAYLWQQYAKFASVFRCLRVKSTSNYKLNGARGGDDQGGAVPTNV